MSDESNPYEFIHDETTPRQPLPASRPRDCVVVVIKLWCGLLAIGIVADAFSLTLPESTGTTFVLVPLLWLMTISAPCTMAGLCLIRHRLNRLRVWLAAIVLTAMCGFVTISVIALWALSVLAS